MDTNTDSPTWGLRFGDILAAAGLNPTEVMLIRHTYTKGGLETALDLADDRLLAYTRIQGVSNKVTKHPPRIWLNFIADGGRRARFVSAFANQGERLGERTSTDRCFDLRISDLLSSLKNRLVIEWSSDTVNWAKPGTAAEQFPIVEIADPESVPFPGFDRIVINYDLLQIMIDDSRYASWRTALGSVQGIYLIADTSSGRLYVGKADGSERILGRWREYARNGHGGNVELKRLLSLDPAHARHFRYSLLRVFGPSVPMPEVNEAESHYKTALLTTRGWGLNRN